MTRENQKSYVYLLRSLKDEKFYVGWTTDLKGRIEEHNRGRSAYTRSRRPWRLVGYEEYPSIEEAKGRERVLKRNPRMYFLFKKRFLNSPTTDGKTQVVGQRQVVG